MNEEFQKIKKRFLEYEADPRPLDPRYFGAAIGVLTRACGTIQRRHMLQFYLTGHEHVADMTEAQKYALSKFVSPTSEVKGLWTSELGDRFYRNIEVVLNYQPPEEECPF